MDTFIIEYGSVGIIVVLAVEIGKRTFPRIFTSDMNVWLSMLIAIAVNGAYAASTGASVWDSIPHGAIVGLAASGLYRGVSVSAKRSSIDLTEQAHETVVTTPGDIRDIVHQAIHGDDDEKEPIGFVKGEK